MPNWPRYERGYFFISGGSVTNRMRRSRGGRGAKARRGLVKNHQPDLGVGRGHQGGIRLRREGKPHRTKRALPILGLPQPGPALMYGGKLTKICGIFSQGSLRRAGTPPLQPCAWSGRTMPCGAKLLQDVAGKPYAFAHLQPSVCAASCRRSARHGSGPCRASAVRQNLSSAPQHRYCETPRHLPARALQE